MNFNKHVIALVSVLLLGFSSANAGILVEPYLGFKIASGDKANTEYSFNTPAIGGRVGYQFLGFMGGLDYSMSSGEFDLKSEFTNSSVTVSRKQDQFGVFVGYELPILFRVWGTYFLSSNIESSNGDKNKGSGYSLGGGFTGLPFVSLNLELRSISYDTYFDKASGAESSIAPTSDFTEILLSVSLPIDL